MTTPNTHFTPEIGGFRPIAQREEATWELMEDVIRTSGLIVKRPGSRPLTRFMDPDEANRMHDAGVRPTQLLQTLGERLEPGENDPITVRTKLEAVGRRAATLALSLLTIGLELGDTALSSPGRVWQKVPHHRHTNVVSASRCAAPPKKRGH